MRPQARWQDDNLTLVSPPLDMEERLAALGESWLRWLDVAARQRDCRLYAILVDEMAVGLIFLHNIVRHRQEAMVGYALLPDHRGQGLGKRALALLQQIAIADGLLTLTIITGQHNAASRAMAARCGFVCVGPAREAPNELIVYQWHRPDTVETATPDN